jgi:hypothetical protein
VARGSDKVPSPNRKIKLVMIRDFANLFFDEEGGITVFVRRVTFSVQVMCI